MPSIGRWKFPKSRSGRRPISVAKLLKREGEGKLFKKHSAQATHDHDYADNEFDTTGLPALRRKQRYELPSRDEVDITPKPTVEARQDNMGTITTGQLGTPGGFDDLGKTASTDKFAKALETLGELSRTWEVPNDDDDLSGAEQTDRHGPFGVTMSQISAATDLEETKAASIRHQANLSQIFEDAFIGELQKIAAANAGHLPWVGELEGPGGFRHFVDHTILKEAMSFGQIGQGVRSAVGRLRPGGGAAPAMPEVQAFRKGTGFFSTGMGKDLAAGGKALAHNPQAAGRAAGLGAKDLGALQQMRPTGAGRRIAGEVAHGAGHHISHSNPLQLALNPIGTGMGGAIEGAARGVGKELAGSARRGVQTTGRLLQQHAPKIGLGGELVAGGFLHTPGLASAIGGAVAPAAHGVAQHVIGEGAQRIGKAIPSAVRGAAGRVAGMAGRMAA